MIRPLQGLFNGWNPLITRANCDTQWSTLKASTPNHLSEFFLVLISSYSPFTAMRYFLFAVLHIRKALHGSSSSHLVPLYSPDTVKEHILNHRYLFQKWEGRGAAILLPREHIPSHHCRQTTRNGLAFSSKVHDGHRQAHAKLDSATQFYHGSMFPLPGSFSYTERTHQQQTGL